MRGVQSFGATMASTNVPVIGTDTAVSSAIREDDQNAVTNEGPPSTAVPGKRKRKKIVKKVFLQANENLSAEEI